MCLSTPPLCSGIQSEDYVKLTLGKSFMAPSVSSSFTLVGGYTPGSYAPRGDLDTQLFNHQYIMSTSHESCTHRFGRQTRLAGANFHQVNDSLLTALCSHRYSLAPCGLTRLALARIPINPRHKANFASLSLLYWLTAAG